MVERKEGALTVPSWRCSRCRSRTVATSAGCHVGPCTHRTHISPCSKMEGTAGAVEKGARPHRFVMLLQPLQKSAGSDSSVTPCDTDLHTA